MTVHQLTPGDTITQDEAQALILSLARSRAGNGFTNYEAAAVIQWAHNTQVQHAILTLVLTGLAEIGLEAGQITISRAAATHRTEHTP